MDGEESLLLNCLQKPGATERECQVHIADAVRMVKSDISLVALVCNPLTPTDTDDTSGKIASVEYIVLHPAA
jgi:hypothetical protein